MVRITLQRQHRLTPPSQDRPRPALPPDVGLGHDALQTVAELKEGVGLEEGQALKQEAAATGGGD